MASIVVAGGLLLAAGPASGCAREPVAPVASRRSPPPEATTCAGTVRSQGRLSIRVDGTQRHFFLRLPADYDGKRLRPLVVVFHGFMQPARKMEKVMSFAREWPDAIVVYPRGLMRRFAIFPDVEGQGWQIAPGELGDRDMAFFDALLAWIGDRYCVDPARVFVAGISNGSYFAQLVACLRPQWIAGVAAASGGMHCLPRGGVPVLLSHGREDDVVPFSEGTAAEAAWAVRNGCGEAREPAGEGCEARRGCRGADVVFCTHGNGHAFWDPAFLERAVTFFRRRARTEDG